MLKDQSEMPFEAPETTDFRWHFETEKRSAVLEIGWP
jgi:hypothetical protein